MTNEELIKKAYEAMEFAYAPYSKFKVGAALLTETGKVYLGCNIENASFGATNCAERTAIFKAISEGERKFSKIAVVGINHENTFPCGICRQVLMEFMPNAEIIFDSGNELVVYQVRDLLPHHFDLKS